jgi:6-carboxyhexanoate--CoA ligase
MMDYFYNVRMRASREGRHLGGAERLVSQGDWSEAVEELAARARAYPGPEDVRLTSEPVLSCAVSLTAAPPVRTLVAETPELARKLAAGLLEQAGVCGSIARSAIGLLDRGPAPGGGVMRGGVVMDAATGERLESDSRRGVRATRMDYTPRCRSALAAWLHERGLTSHRTMEAIVVAAKVLWSGAIAELCWSDDPDYLAGYVASPEAGYCRFDNIKQPGRPIGGRVFFLASAEDMPAFVQRMEHDAILVDCLAASMEIACG